MAENENPARTQAAANTRELIRWASEAISKPLPEPVRRRAATILADDIGAMVAGALAVAYEVTTRFALAFPFPAFNVHPHAAFATIGAAAAASLVRRHDAKTLLDAVTGAASMSFAGPFDTAVEGSLVRNGWTAAGA